jgi:hypothetical protein
VCAAAIAPFALAAPAWADRVPITPDTPLEELPLTPEQREALTAEPIHRTWMETPSTSVAFGTQATSCSAGSTHIGTTLMWTEDTYRWCYTTAKVTSSWLQQSAGYIFPNIAKNRGASRYSTANAHHKWRAQHTIGAGVVTPWGDATVYENNITYYYKLNRGGSRQASQSPL